MERLASREQMRHYANRRWAIGYEREHERNQIEAMQCEEAEVDQQLKLLQDRKELLKMEQYNVRYERDYVLKQILEREQFEFLGQAMRSFILAFSTFLPREIRDMVYRELVPRYTNIWKHHDHRELSPALWAFEHHEILPPWTVDVLGEQIRLRVWYLREIFAVGTTGEAPATVGLVRHINVQAECSHVFKIPSSIGTSVWTEWASQLFKALLEAMPQMIELLSSRCHLTIQIGGPRNSSSNHHDPPKWKPGLHSDIESLASSIWALHDLGCTVEVFFGSRKFKVASDTKYFQYQKKLSKWAMDQEKRYMSIYKKHVPSGRLHVSILRQHSVGSNGMLPTGSSSFACSMCKLHPNHT